MNYNLSRKDKLRKRRASQQRKANSVAHASLVFDQLLASGKVISFAPDDKGELHIKLDDLHRKEEKHEEQPKG